MRVFGYLHHTGLEMDQLPIGSMVMVFVLPAAAAGSAGVGMIPACARCERGR